MVQRPQDVVNSLTTTDSPSSLQNRVEYNGDQTMAYNGWAARGASSSDDVWTIFKYTYVAQQMTLKQTAFCSWDDRSSGVYA